MTRARACPDVVVIGGGLAGISAAIDLADAGCEVTVIEGRPWLGGATCSFTRRGLTIDNGQHVFLRSHTAYRELLSRLGTGGLCELQDRLDLTVLADTGEAGEPSSARLRRSKLPAPAHLAGTLARYRLLPPGARARAAAGALALRRAASPDGGEATLASWLEGRKQTGPLAQMLWDWLCTATINAVPERADLGLAAAAIRAAVLGGRDHADLGVPAAAFSTLHGAPAADLLARLGVRVRLSTQAAAVHGAEPGRYLVTVVGAATGAEPPGIGVPEQLQADGVVLAVPPSQAASLVPGELAAQASRWRLLRPSPVVSVHVMYDRPVTDLPFAAVAGAPVAWVADKSAAAGLNAGQYLAASLPAADEYVAMTGGQLREIVLPLLERLFPAAAEAGISDVFVTRERRATILHEPGVQRLRPAAGGGLTGLAVAGGWTGTGWPDSMESAVRSGRAAASQLLAALAGASLHAEAEAEAETAAGAEAEPAAGEVETGPAAGDAAAAGPASAAVPDAPATRAGPGQNGEEASGPAGIPAAVA